MWNKMKLTRSGVVLGIILSFIAFPFISFPTAMQFTEASTGLNNGVSTATWYVNATLGIDDGSHGTGTGTQAFQTIPYAVNTANSGDTVMVEAGTHTATWINIGVLYDYYYSSSETIFASLVLDKPIRIIGAGTNTTFFYGKIVITPSTDQGPVGYSGWTIDPTYQWKGSVGEIEISNITLSNDKATDYTNGSCIDVFGEYNSATFTIVDIFNTNLEGRAVPWARDNALFTRRVGNTQAVHICQNSFSGWHKAIENQDCHGELIVRENTADNFHGSYFSDKYWGAVFSYDYDGYFANVATVTATLEYSYNTLTLTGPMVHEGQPAIFILTANTPSVDTILNNIQIHHNTIETNQLGEWPSATLMGIRGRGIIEIRNTYSDESSGVQGGSIHDNYLIGPGTDTGLMGQGIRIRGYNSSLSIYNNQISQCPEGMLFDRLVGISAPSSIWVYGNEITQTNTGIHVLEMELGGGGVGVSTYFRYNEILGNNFGVSNSTTVPFDFTNNWWGTALGPYHPVLNPSGTGNSVSDYVDFIPWSGEPIPGTAYQTTAPSTTSWTVSTPSDTVVIAAEGTDGTPTNTVGSCELDGQPLNLPPFDTTGQKPVTVYDVNASGFTTGTVTLTFTYEHNSGEDSYTLWYWDGLAWTLVPTQGNTGHTGTPSHTLWGVVPIAALGGTPFVIGAPSGPVGAPSLSIWGLASLALALLGGGVWTLRKKKS